jgi:hypothetical protein
VNSRPRWTLVVALAVACVAPKLASSQTTGTSSSAAAAPGDPSKMWIVIGGASTTLRGDCQEGCAQQGAGEYLNTGSVLAIGGVRVHQQLDAGVEAIWVPATTKAGEKLRSTFLLGTAQFRPWQTHGFFLNAGMGMAFVRNFVYGDGKTAAPITSKALGLIYGAGWTFRHTDRISTQIFGSQHVAALGDFQTGGVTVENVVGNFWSIGAALVIR